MPQNVDNVNVYLHHLHTTVPAEVLYLVFDGGCGSCDLFNTLLLASVHTHAHRSVVVKLRAT